MSLSYFKTNVICSHVTRISFKTLYDISSIMVGKYDIVSV